MLTELTQFIDLLVTSATGQRAEGARTPQQSGGLVPGHGHTLGQVDIRAALERHIGALPVNQTHQRPAEHPGTRRPVLAVSEHIERRGQQGVTGKDRLTDAEHRPRGGAMPTHHILIHDIVVQQREACCSPDGARTTRPDWSARPRCSPSPTWRSRSSRRLRDPLTEIRAAIQGERARRAVADQPR
jgi:hypothetical protein